MLGYAMVGTRDLPRALGFYDPLLTGLGATRCAAWSSETTVYYQDAAGKPFFGVGLPFDGNEASCGNGVMLALLCPDMDSVRRGHATALDSGGSDEGRPGWRTEDFFGGYLRDPDGNKLCLYTSGTRAALDPEGEVIGYQ